MNQQKKSYKEPTVKMVAFMIERGFEGSPYRIVQPDTDTDGMNEQMNYDENNSNLGWDWHIN